MSIVILVEWHIKPDRIISAKDLLNSTYSGTQQYEGCHRYEIYEDREKPDCIFLLTEWDTQEQYASYMAWRKETGILAQFAETFAESPKIHYLQAIAS